MTVFEIARRDRARRQARDFFARRKETAASGPGTYPSGERLRRFVEADEAISSQLVSLEAGDNPIRGGDIWTDEFWLKLRFEWVVFLQRVLSCLEAELPDQEIEMGAFWLLYADGTKIGHPSISLRTREFAESCPDLLVHPPDWPFIAGPAERLKSLYAQLERLEVAPDLFDRLVCRHDSCLVEVCNRISDEVTVGSSGSVEPNFFMCVLDEDYDPELRLLDRTLSSEVRRRWPSFAVLLD